MHLENRVYKPHNCIHHCHHRIYSCPFPLALSPLVACPCIRLSGNIHIAWHTNIYDFGWWFHFKSTVKKMRGHRLDSFQPIDRYIFFLSESSKPMYAWIRHHKLQSTTHSKSLLEATNWLRSFILVDDLGWLILSCMLYATEVLTHLHNMFSCGFWNLSIYLDHSKQFLYGYRSWPAVVG